MNIRERDQVVDVTTLFENQYSELLPAFEKVLARLQEEGDRTEVSLAELKHLARMETKNYRDEMDKAVYASKHELVISDLVPDIEESVEN